MHWIITALMVALSIWMAGPSADRPPAAIPADQTADAERSTARGDVAAYGGGVVGGPHDLTGLIGGRGNACSACHVPHVLAARPAPAVNSNGQPIDDQPTLLELYRLGGQRQVFTPDRYTPGPTSLVCLGCHDGTIADSTIGSSHALLAGVRAGFDVPDGFVWRDHPIGVPYPRSGRKYRPVSMVLAGGVIRMPEGRVECVSCHDPHGVSGQPDMLVMSNRRSALCLACHRK